MVERVTIRDRGLMMLKRMGWLAGMLTAHFTLLVMVALPMVVLPAFVLSVHGDEFPAPRNTQAGSETLLTAKEALQKIKVPAGFQVSLFAGEPDVQQPISLTTDSRGRLWVAENYTYAESATNFDLRQRDRIVILEDTNHDGQMDKRTVFWDQGVRLTSVEVGFGGVWALCPPNLLFIPDRDGDDRADGPAEVVLDGWNDGSVRHNVVNGLKWGPDGWLYGRHGILATSLVGKPGDGPSQRTKINCGIWRYHPVKSAFETVVHGGTNSWGFDYDQYGEMFFINTVIGHLWHVVPGAHYRRMYGVDFHPHLYQLIEQTADHFHWDTREAWSDIRKGVTDTTSQAGGGHAHSGLMIYQGDNWPAEYRGDVFTVNYHGRRLNRDHLERHGAGYVARHGSDMVYSDDIWFRGIDLISGPDGGVYIADWSDIGECHDNDGIHRTSGRIFKVVYGEPKRRLESDLSKMSTDALAGLVTHADVWYPRQARRLLQERAVRGEDLSAARRTLLRVFEEASVDVHRLRALWALHAIGCEQSWWLERLADRQESVRAWAVRLLCDKSVSPSIDPPLAQQLATLATREQSPLVLLHLASALQKLDVKDRGPLANALITRDSLHDDLAFPSMVWYGLEPVIAAESRLPAGSRRAVAMLESAKIPVLQKFIARRLASDWDANRETLAQIVERLPGWGVALQRESLTGLRDALVGLRKVAPPPGWEAMVRRVEASAEPQVAERLRELSVVFGDGRAIEQIREMVANTAVDSQTRQLALRSLVLARDEESVPLLLKLIADRVLTNEVIRGLASFDRPEIPAAVLGQYGALDQDGRLAAVDTLVARPNYAEVLLQAVREGRVRRSDISAFHARQILSFDKVPLTKSLTEVWGEVRSSEGARRDQIQMLKDLATADRIKQADPRAGRALFQKSCSNCHVLYGQGKQVGPDLTGSNRRNLDYLLENIVDPSAVVAADFRAQVFRINDGRVVNGVIVEQGEKVLRVQTATEQVLLDRQEIEQTQATSQSLMPEGLLKDLSDAERLNLFAYLMSTEPPAP
ncbi:MAG: hypothetical protein RIS70_3379 [Planctomycetota bacterium]